MANDNVAYGGWRKLDCMSTSDNLLALKKACGVFASPIIKSDRGVKLVVTCGSWIKNFKMEISKRLSLYFIHRNLFLLLCR